MSATHSGTRKRTRKNVRHTGLTGPGDGGMRKGNLSIDQPTYQNGSHTSKVKAGCAIAGILQRGVVYRSELHMNFMFSLTNLATTVLCRLPPRLLMFILSDMRSAHCVICCHHGLDWKLICPRHATTFFFMPSIHRQTHKTTLLAPACQPCYSSARAFFMKSAGLIHAKHELAQNCPVEAPVPPAKRKVSTGYLPHLGYVHR